MYINFLIILIQYPSQQYPTQQYPSQVWNSPYALVAWPPQHVQHQPWKQGWHGHPYENMPTFPPQSST
jgi:hypothetical protein